MRIRHDFYQAKKFGHLERELARAIDERIREKYSLSNELAILRQRDTKPEEFAAYNEFVEQVKAEVKAECEAYIAKYEKLFGVLP